MSLDQTHQPPLLSILMSLNIGCITQNINFDDDDDDTRIRFRAILFSNTRIRMKMRQQAQRDGPGVQGEATDI